ncbi:MAG: cell division protein ZapA [Steroidobacteraceae bacterium]|nr:cell division protein ZapA [Steroidobacteraceae bacterium]MDW8257957.1 cell division protein ZapA [Gammaproteobacteria bacterium]
MTDKGPLRVSVRILDKEYQVACPPEEKAELLAAAEQLDQRMRAIRETGKVVGLDRIAVMAGLNLAHDMLKLRAKAESVDGNVMPRVRNLREKIDKALLRNKQLDL